MEGSGVVEYEQISNQSYPYPPYLPYPYAYPYPAPYPYPPHPPSTQPIDPNNWPYTHPSAPYPPFPYYFYYPEYGSPNYNEDYYSNCTVQPNFIRRRSLSQEKFRDNRRFAKDSHRNSAPPNIIVTPSFDENEENRFDDQEYENFHNNRAVRAGSVIDVLSDKLSNFNNSDILQLNIKQNGDKKYAGETNKTFGNSTSPNLLSSHHSSPHSITPNTYEKSDSDNNKLLNESDNEFSSTGKDQNNTSDDIQAESNDNHEERKQNYRKAMDFFQNQKKDIEKSDSESFRKPVVSQEHHEKVIPKINLTVYNEQQQQQKHNLEEGEDEEISEDSETEESDETDESESDGMLKKPDFKLKSIRSVTNIRIYNEETDDDQTTIEDGSKVFDENGEETDFDEYSLDDGTEVLEDNCDGYEDDDEIGNQQIIIIEDDLSIIYEESENGGSKCSTNKRKIETQLNDSDNDSSETIGNDDDEDDKDTEDVDENDSNLVSVRLPLRLSFSKSLNDENITTVVVGKSEIEDQSKSFSVASIVDDNDEDNDTVSVTLSLSSSRSGSFEKCGSNNNINKFAINQIHEEAHNCSDSDGDGEVSVSFLLPIKNKCTTDHLQEKNSTNTLTAESNNNNKIKECDKIENEEDPNAIMLSASYKNIWQSFGTTLKDIATKEDPEPSTSWLSNYDNSTNKLNTVQDDVEDFWATIKDSKKREVTPDFWGTINGTSTENIDESVETKDEVIGDENIDDFWKSADEKQDKQDLKMEPINLDDFWDKSGQQTSSIEIQITDDCEDFWANNFHDEDKDDDQNQVNSNDYVDESVDLDNFWGSTDDTLSTASVESNHSEEKRKNYKAAMEFFKNQTSIEAAAKKTDPELSPPKDKKEKFQKSWNSYQDSVDEIVVENNSKLHNDDNDQDGDWKLKSTRVKSELKIFMGDNNSDENRYHEEDGAVNHEEDLDEDNETNIETTTEYVCDFHKELGDKKVVEILNHNIKKREMYSRDDENEEIECEEVDYEETSEEDEEAEEEEEEEEEEVEQEEKNHGYKYQENFHFNDNNNATKFFNSPAYQFTSAEPSESQEKPNVTVSNDVKETTGEELKVSVRDKIMAFETGVLLDNDNSDSRNQQHPIITSSLEDKIKDNLSRTSSLQRSESELEEDDSGVTDMGKHISETDTESECFPELKKLTRYQRAATHSRLFKLLQDESVSNGNETPDFSKEDDEEAKRLAEEFNIRPSRKKVIHNVSITRRNNPDAIKEAETMIQRRERLSLPLKTSNSIDSDNLSSSNSPTNSNSNSRSNVSDQLVNELVQSLLLKKNSGHLKNLPMEKLQAAAKRVLEEDLDSLENTSLESTPALTPQEFKTDSYTEYYDSWNGNELIGSTNSAPEFDLIPSKAFRNLQEQSSSIGIKRKPWAARCPRVLSSKTINRDLTRVSESPELFRGSSIIRSSTERDSDNCYSRASSLTRRKL